jgi:predicted nucleotidyltransferase
MSRTHQLALRDREDIVRTLSRAISGRRDVAFAYLYGSFAPPEPFRDIDVAVWTTTHDADEPTWSLARSCLV